MTSLWPSHYPTTYIHKLLQPQILTKLVILQKSCITNIGHRNYHMMQDNIFAKPLFVTTSVWDHHLLSDMNARNVVPCNALSMTPLWSYQWLLDRKGPDPKIMLSICPPGRTLLIRFMSSCPHIYKYYCKLKQVYCAWLNKGLLCLYIYWEKAKIWPGDTDP